MENSTYMSSNVFCQERVVLSSSFHIPPHGQWHANQVLHAADPQQHNMEKNVWCPSTLAHARSSGKSLLLSICTSSFCCHFKKFQDVGQNV